MNESENHVRLTQPSEAAAIIQNSHYQLAFFHRMCFFVVLCLQATSVMLFFITFQSRRKASYLITNLTPLWQAVARKKGGTGRALSISSMKAKAPHTGIIIKHALVYPNGAKGEAVV